MPNRSKFVREASLLVCLSASSVCFAQSNGVREIDFAVAPVDITDADIGRPLDDAFRWVDSGRSNDVPSQVRFVRRTLTMSRLNSIDSEDRFRANISVLSLLSAGRSGHQVGSYGLFSASVIQSITSYDGVPSTPPPTAAWYISRIYYGRSYEAVFRQQRSDTSVWATGRLPRVDGLGIEEFARTNSLSYVTRSRGLLPRGSIATLAMDSSGVQQNYEIDQSSQASPVYVTYTSFPSSAQQQLSVGVSFSRLIIVRSGPRNPTLTLSMLCRVNGRHHMGPQLLFSGPASAASTHVGGFPVSGSTVFYVGSDDLLECGIQGEWSGFLSRGIIPFGGFSWRAGSSVSGNFIRTITVGGADEWRVEGTIYVR